MAIKKKIFRSVFVLYLIAFIYLTFKHFQIENLLVVINRFIASPVLVFTLFLLYGTSFVLRAVSWRLYLKNLVSLKECLNGLWYSLFINHLFPIKLGDLVRIGYLTSRQKIFTVGEIANSVIIMRFFDMLTLILYSSIGIYFLTHSIVLNSSISLYILLGIFGLFIILILYRYRPELIKKQGSMIINAFNNRNSYLILLCILVSWILEASVVFSIANLFDNRLSIPQSIWVNSITVGGQIFQFLPGGVATYETTMAFALSHFRFSLSDSYNLAVVTHMFKFIFSYIMGAYVLWTAPVTRNELRHWIKKQSEKE